MPKKRKRGSSLSNKKKYHRLKGSTIQKRINGQVVYAKKEVQRLPSVKKTKQEQSDNNSGINPNEYVCLKRNIENLDNDEIRVNKKTHSFEKRQRVAIAFVYEHIHNMLDKEKWAEYNLISQISDLLKLSSGSFKLIDKVLNDFLHCVENGVEYDGNRQYKEWRDDKHLLPLDSNECKLIADVMEDGHGLRAAATFVNEYR